MIPKILISLSCIISTLALKSQSLVNSVHINFDEYHVYHGDTLVIPCILEYREGVSQFFQLFSQVGIDVNDPEALEKAKKSNKPIMFKGHDLMMFRDFNNAKTVIYHPAIVDKFYYVRDEFDLQWKTTKEEKEILGFKCQKAVTEFRGRTYEAWFTKDIPFPVGPHKFFGLSSTILEVSSLDGKFYWRPTKVSLNFLEDNPKELAEHIEGFNSNIKMVFEKVPIISREEYLQKLHKKTLDDNKNSMSRSNGRSSISIPGETMENEYEPIRKELDALRNKFYSN